MNIPDTRLLSIKNVAHILGCKDQQIYRYVRVGLLDFCRVRLGTMRTIKFDYHKLMVAINEGTIGSGKTVSLTEKNGGLDE